LMNLIANYEKKVYAALLGKVIGVYMGRPFEGWARARLEERWGRVDRYVHEDVDKPLVVADDDISGTLTFVRALEDSGKYADTPTEFFGDTWLNYLLEGQTVLWWGGMGVSTEHTAYLRLKHGLKAPLSGAIATNGQTVAEQIGAQIFIDAFGMVAPGNPKLAATMARRAASVSHDGEAVNAAIVVAGMVSAAFVETDMERLLDIGASLIPDDSLIARIHHDVRCWQREDGDWRRTWERINEAYGYHRYGGNCHVVPNHAIMVLAWCYAPDDFHEAQVIINTAGWDTDCNAANVGSVMGVKVGLDRISEVYDFQSPFADRVILPTAEGTRGFTDVLNEALHVARIGRHVMGWPEAVPPKEGAWHHFSLPGALHGYMSDETAFESRGNATLTNTAVPPTGEHGMQVDFRCDAGRVARISTPILAAGKSGSYGIVATPRLCSGMSVHMAISASEVVGAVIARLFVRHSGEGVCCYSPATSLEKGQDTVLHLTIESIGGMPVSDFGLEMQSPSRASGRLLVDRVWFDGKPAMEWPDGPAVREGTFPGWIKHADVVRGGFSDDSERMIHVGKNEGRGILVTGTSDWGDYAFRSRVKIHLADAGGIIVRYQGMERYIALLKTPDALRLILRLNGEERVLDEVPMAWPFDEAHDLELICHGEGLLASCDGEIVLRGRDRWLRCGGAGFLFENGLLGFRGVAVGPLVDPILTESRAK
jgi:ADP-ribosylglycohydrolase